MQTKTLSFNEETLLNLNGFNRELFFQQWSALDKIGQSFEREYIDPIKKLYLGRFKTEMRTLFSGIRSVFIELEHGCWDSLLFRINDGEEKIYTLEKPLPRLNSAIYPKITVTHKGAYLSFRASLGDLPVDFIWDINLMGDQMNISAANSRFYLVGK